MRTLHKSHKWEDISRHGSIELECAYCNILGTHSEAFFVCPKLDEILLKKAVEQERQERQEYQEMERMFERWDYLKSKYGR